MIIMKFGGSSVKDVAALERVVGIIGSRCHEDPVVVVSAMGDSTDRLTKILDLLERGQNAQARATAKRLSSDHASIARKILPEGEILSELLKTIQSHFSRMDNLIEGMACLGEVSPRSRDAVLSFGEIASSSMLAAYCRSVNIPAEAIDPTKLILTDARFTGATPDPAGTKKRCAQFLSPVVARMAIPVVGGFVGADEHGVTTTLGRGGSDLTASILAGAMNASALEYWKDVDGILDADPRIVPQAKPVQRITFREAAELATLGAKILHPASIQPAVLANVPVRVLNFNEPLANGTTITSAAEPDHDFPDRSSPAVSSITYKRSQAMINIYSTRMLGTSGFLRRVFEVFDRLKISVDHIATSEVNVTVTVGRTDALEALRRELAEIATVSVDDNVGVVSLVGERLPATPGVAARIFRALTGINVSLITYGGSGVNLSVVVGNDNVDTAVRKLHKELFETSEDGDHDDV